MYIFSVYFFQLRPCWRRTHWSVALIMGPATTAQALPSGLHCFLSVYLYLSLKSLKMVRFVAKLMLYDHPRLERKMGIYTRSNCLNRMRKIPKKKEIVLRGGPLLDESKTKVLLQFMSTQMSTSCWVLRFLVR